MLPLLANYDRLAEFDFTDKKIKMVGRDIKSHNLTIIAYNNCSILSQSCDTDIDPKDSKLKHALFQINRDNK